MWILIISAIVFPAIVLRMPKRISRVYLYATTGMAIYAQLLTDVFVHVELNWYGYFNALPKSEPATLLFVPIYISINPLFLNFFPYESRIMKKIAYILGWSAFAVLYEWCLDLNGVFYHNEWKLYHSAMTYPILFTLLRIQLSLVKKLNRKDTVDNR